MSDIEHTGSAIILWSVPRARSTAFERMMFERQDHVTVHEPFSRVCDFGTSEVDGTTCGSQRDVIAAVNHISDNKPVFVKDTLDFRFDDVLNDAAFLRRHRHCVMIRHPHEAVRSYLRLDPDGTADSVGFGWLAELARHIEQATGAYPHVVEAANLMADAPATVQEFCSAVGIDFLPEALDFQRDPPSSWQTTKRWHDAAASTIALGKPPASQEPDNEVPKGRVAAIVAEVWNSYEEIRGHARATPRRNADA